MDYEWSVKRLAELEALLADPKTYEEPARMPVLL